MAWWTWGPLTGALIRSVPATVLNVSTRGCLIQTAARLDPGAVGVLVVEGGDNPHSEAVRVCHAIERPGSTLPFCAGTEFMVFDAAAAPSVRHRAARLEAGQRLSRLVDARENSGTNATSPKVGRRGRRLGRREITRDSSGS
jgi:hypothetical protein